jgi:hypothetical protein
MKLIKYMLYILGIVLLSLYCYNFYHFHPEIQFVFLVPGVFLIIFSSILTDIQQSKTLRGRAARH